MLLNRNIDPRDHSSCVLSYNEAESWMQAVWSGYVDQVEALRGGQAYLARVFQHPCPLLLNDNYLLTGPWFESLDWLLHIWVPEAERLGLRYVAHVVQADSHHDIFTDSHSVDLPFELQIFQDRGDACQWLRTQRDAHVAGLLADLG